MKKYEIRKMEYRKLKNSYNTPGQGFEPWRSHAPRDLKSRALPG